MNRSGFAGDSLVQIFEGEHETQLKRAVHWSKWPVVLFWRDAWVSSTGSNTEWL